MQTDSTRSSSNPPLSPQILLFSLSISTKKNPTTHLPHVHRTSGCEVNSHNHTCRTVSLILQTESWGPESHETPVKIHGFVYNEDIKRELNRILWSQKLSYVLTVCLYWSWLIISHKPCGKGFFFNSYQSTANFHERDLEIICEVQYKYESRIHVVYY
jgi:hypothetical protein